MEYPVLAFSHCRDVVAAVTRAGGFGVLGATILTPEQLEIERLRRRNERLEADLAKHRLALEIQGKASALLERLLAEGDEQTRQQP